jgi:hypothetical protein
MKDFFLDGSIVQCMSWLLWLLGNFVLSLTLLSISTNTLYVGL